MKSFDDLQAAWHNLIKEVRDAVGNDISGIKILYRFLTEPFRAPYDFKSLKWRMGMRWSHFPNWVRRIPCIFGHWWGPWEHIKCDTPNMQRGCTSCSKSEIR